MSQITKSTVGSLLTHATNLNPEAFAQFGQVIQNPATHEGEPRGLEGVDVNQGSARKWIDVADLRSWYAWGQSRKAARAVLNMFVCRPRALVERQGKKVFPVQILERHPFTSQTFVPVGVGREEEEEEEGTRYLVIVAPTLPATSGRKGEEMRPPYPMPPKQQQQPRRSLRERLLGARPNPFTNDFASSTESTNTDDLPAGQKPKGTGPPDFENLKAFIARGDQAVTYGPGTWHAPMVVLGEKPIEFVVVQYANGVGAEECQEVEISAPDGGEGLAVDVSAMGQGGGALRAKL